jgi:hypothetical protein
MPAERAPFRRDGSISERQSEQQPQQEGPKKRDRPPLLSDAEKKARQREYNQRYHQQHKDTMLDRYKRYYQEQKDEILEKHKRYRQEHRDEIKLYTKRYRQENAEKRKIYLREWRRKRKEESGNTSETHASTAIQVFPHPDGDKH